MEFGSSSISPCFSYQLDKIYRQGILELSTGKHSKNGINGYCQSAISIYPLTIATWESLFHEIFLAESNLLSNNHTKEINSIPLEKIKWWSISDKTVDVLEMLYGKTFDKGKQPYQDFQLLVTLRNAIVHFNLGDPDRKTIAALKNLSRQNIFFPLIDFSHTPGVSHSNIWTHIISTTEGIRWAINTIKNMAMELNNIVPENKRPFSFDLINNLDYIDKEKAIRYFYELGVDPGTKIGIKN